MIDTLDASYDYASLMHYGPKAFSSNGQDTIIPKQKGVSIGQRIAFSKLDSHKINKLYRCHNRKTGSFVFFKSFNRSFNQNISKIYRFENQRFNSYLQQEPVIKKIR